MQEFSRHHWHFTAETSMPKRKYQGMVGGRLPTQCVLNKMVFTHSLSTPSSEDRSLFTRGIYLVYNDSVG